MSARFKPSVTVAAVIEREGRYLLVEEHTRFGLQLNNPAGHLERGEDLLQAVRREVREEAAYDFTATGCVGVYLSNQGAGSERTAYVRFTFCGELGAHYPEQPLDAGIVRTLWLSLEEVEAASHAGRLRSSMVLKSILDYAQGQRLPLSALYADASIYEMGDEMGAEVMVEGAGHAAPSAQVPVAHIG